MKVIVYDKFYQSQNEKIERMKKVLLQKDGKLFLIHQKPLHL